MIIKLKEHGCGSVQSSDVQSLRKRNGDSFEDACRRSWMALPGVWRTKLSDVAGCGSRPADELILSMDHNFLCEEKSCDSDVFPLNMIRTDQVRGLLDFESSVPGRNISLVAVRFASESHVFLFRFKDFLTYLHSRNRNQICREDLSKKAFRNIWCPQIMIHPETYDFGEVFCLC